MKTSASMENLDLIRAKAALALCLPPPEPKPKNYQPPFDRADVASIPSLILSNGLLAAAAFCCEDKDARKGLKTAFNGIAKHLNSRKITTGTDGPALITGLANGDSLTLQRATAEALAFLAFLKRFAPKKED